MAATSSQLQCKAAFTLQTVQSVAGQELPCALQSQQQQPSLRRVACQCLTLSMQQ